MTRRSSVRPENAETLPSIEDLIGDSQKASQDADALQSMAINLRRLKDLQVNEAAKESDNIPGALDKDGNTKTFKQQYDQILAAYKEKWKRIEAEGLTKLVQRELDDRKRQ
jgi:hypothetical protein